MSKLLTAGIVAIAVPVAAFLGSTSMSTDSDEAGLVYNAGPISNTRFDTCVGTGSREWDGPFDKHIVYPAGRRTYRFDLDKGADRGPITVATNDPMELDVVGQVSLELNVSCEDATKKYPGGVFQEFHERIGNKYKPTIEDGETTDKWRNFLNDYLGIVLQRALSEATQQVGWNALYSDAKAKAAWEKKVLDVLPVYLKQAMGGDYLKVTSVTIQKPGLPKNLSAALEGKQVAIQENAAQAEKNAKITTELKSIQDLVKVLGVDGYNTYQAIKDGKVSVMPIPQGSGVVLAPQQGK